MIYMNKVPCIQIQVKSSLGQYFVHPLQAASFLLDAHDDPFLMPAVD